MKNLALASLLLIALSPAGFAAEAVATQPVEAAKSAKPAPRQTEAERKKIADMRQRIELKKTELNGSKWELALGSQDPKMKEKKDVFVFQDGIFRSENLSKRGFTPTNYTVSVGPDEKSESAVWETMQTGKEGLVFIRGEWRKENMQGRVTEQLDGGKKVLEYYFSTSGRKSIPPTSKKEPSSEGGVSKDGDGGTALVSTEKGKNDTEPVLNKQVVESFVPGTTDEEEKPKRG